MRFSLVSVAAALAGTALSQFQALFDGCLVSLANGDHQLSAASVQAVAQALAMVKTGTPIDAVNAYLGASTGGIVTDIDVTLGIDVVAVVMDNVQ